MNATSVVLLMEQNENKTSTSTYICIKELRYVNQVCMSSDTCIRGREAQDGWSGPKAFKGNNNMNLPNRIEKRKPCIACLRNARLVAF